MLKGKSLEIKGSICNIPVSEVDVNFNMLPRPADSNGLIIVKLKQKLEYKGHVVFEAVRPDLVIQFLEFFRSHNDLYSDIESKEGIVAATGEGKKPVSILNDKFCQDVGHPYLFPTGQYG